MATSIQLSSHNSEIRNFIKLVFSFVSRLSPTSHQYHDRKNVSKINKENKFSDNHFHFSRQVTQQKKTISNQGQIMILYYEDNNKRKLEWK